MKKIYTGIVISFLFFQSVFSQTPTVISFTPNSGGNNSFINIQGTNFTGATSVKFGGTEASFFYIASPSIIYAYVGLGSSGSVSVTSSFGTGSLSGFTFLPPTTINSFTPSSAFSGATIYVTGHSFTDAVAFSFGDIRATSFTVLSDSTLTAIVGNGTSGNITVTTTRDNATLGYFTYLGPNITSFTPQSGAAGTTVNISGSNFTGATAVSFGGVAATSFNVVSANTITAVTGIGSSGNVAVTTPNGTGTKTGFIEPPVINSFLPTSGPAGILVTINGNNFSNLPTNNIVYFGNIKATVTAATSTSLTVTVPAGGTYLPISISVDGFVGYSTLPFVTTFVGGPFIPASFAAAQPITNNISFLDVSIGDLDNDGKPELVTAKADGSLSIYKNNSISGNIAFATPLNFAISYNLSNATGVAIADFSGDGLPDIAIINYGNNIVSIFTNTSFSGFLSFSNRVDFATAPNPRGIAVGDIDGDGKPDIAVTNYNAQTISIFRNQGGNGSVFFAPRIDYATGVNPYDIVLADFNKDGKLDIATTNESANTISIFKNTTSSGFISFLPKVDIATGASPRGISTGDFDGDGNIDLVVTNAGSATVSVYKNISSIGNIIFNAKVDFITGSGPNSVAVNDFNGDGKLDLSVTSFSTSSIGILKNSTALGNIAFDVRVDYPTLNYPDCNISGDIDLDGKPDIISLNSGLTVIRNKFNEAPFISSFTPSQAGPGDTLTISGRNFSGASAVNVGGLAFNSFSLASDKIIKAIVGAGISGDITVTTPYGTAILAGFIFSAPPVINSFTPTSGGIGTTLVITGNNFNPLPTANIVNFGTVQAQVLSASNNSLTVLVPPGANDKHISVTINGRIGWSNQIFSLTYSGAGSTFNNTYFDTTVRVTLNGLANPGLFNIGDMEGDGKTDFVLSSSVGSIARLVTYRNTTNNGIITFGPKVEHLSGASSGGNPLVADVNGDGKPDVTIQRGNDIFAATIFKNNSTTNSISLGSDLTINYSILGGFSVYPGDFDRDGKIDFIIKSAYSTNIMVYRNTSTSSIISFAAPLFVGVPSNGTFNVTVMVEDFNNDGKPDIAVLNGLSVSVFKNIGVIGVIAFASRINFSSSYGATVAFASDLDGDGKVDIAKLNYDLNTVSIIRNNSTNGNISFESDVNFPVGYLPELIKIADMDGDGKQDLCINNSSSNIISILKNTSTPGSLSFLTKVDIVGNGPGRFLIEDIDNDGKSDIITSNNTNNIIAVLRNKIGEPISTTLCPPVASTLIGSNLSGTNYQWQINTGNGFSNISDNSNYVNTNTGSLQLNSIPSLWYGYEYRCVVDGLNSYIFKLKFSNKWLGSVDNVWENAANWSCGAMPDDNTDVVINTGNVIINSNITIRSLIVNTAATVTVNTGYQLIVLH
jgi:large repetitive protein